MCNGWQDRIYEGTGQCQFTQVDNSSLGTLDVNYDPGWDCCIFYKKCSGSPTGLTREL